MRDDLQAVRACYLVTIGVLGWVAGVSDPDSAGMPADRHPRRRELARPSGVGLDAGS